MSDDDTTTPESANADTQPSADAPGDPGRSAADDAPDSAQPPNGGASTRPDGSGGVAIPAWLAGALVVVLALVVAGAGFAIGRATAPDDDGFRPVVATEDGGPGRLPGGGPGGLPGYPGGPQGRGGGEGPRAIPGSPGERDRTFPGDEDSGDDEVPAPPELPGT